MCEITPVIQGTRKLRSLTVIRLSGQSSGQGLEMRKLCS
jgi:hypothetical protein